MTFRSAVSAAALIAALSPVSATAQSSLGITGGGLTLGFNSSDQTDSLGFAEGWLDVAITGAHGLQLDFGIEDTQSGALGHLATHLYMMPREGQKYGVFATVSDLDGESFTVGTIGLEGRFAVGPKTAVEARLGIGIAHRISAPDNLDFIFAGAGISHEVSDALTIGLHGEVAEFDETNFRAIGYTVMLEAEYRPRRSPISLTAGIGVSGLDGRDGRPSETVATIGITYTFGAQGGDVAQRPFRRANPYAPLALRGLF
jgi:opacity protein-like surface antigen